MFRIFRGYDGSLFMVPYEFGDELWGLGFLVIGIAIMVWLIAVSAGLMYLPLLAILAGVVLLMFMSSESGSGAKNISAYFFCFPFFAYGWTGMNWAMFAAAMPERIKGICSDFCCVRYCTSACTSSFITGF